MKKRIVKNLSLTIIASYLFYSIYKNPDIILNHKEYVAMNNIQIISTVGKLGMLIIALCILGTIVNYLSERFPKMFMFLEPKSNKGKETKQCNGENQNDEERENRNNSELENFCNMEKYKPQECKTKFSDVAGAEEEKAELQEIVEFLKQPSLFKKSGIRIPKGVLLSGPPGTGKTLFARAVAGEAKVPFYYISGSDFVQLYVGVGASRVRNIFEIARKNAPSIVFIDEIDAIGQKRTGSIFGGNSEREQTLNQLLIEMDGFNKSNVIVMAATNRVDMLDEALLRPGRFDRKIVVDLPDVNGREAILRLHATNKDFASDVNLHDVAEITPGFSGAQLENLLNEAAITAFRSHRSISNDDIQDSIYKVMLGLEKKSRVISDSDKRVTAFHEIGHAIVSNKVSGICDVDMISILPRGNTAGFTATKNFDKSSHLTKRAILDRICVLFGGRASEEIMCGDITTGACKDIEEATKLAYDMVTKWGMSNSVAISYLENGHVSEFTKKAIDTTVQEILDSEYLRAKEIINDNFEIIIKVTDKLCDAGKMSGEDFAKLVA